jgi:hypothetical protein
MTVCTTCHAAPSLESRNLGRTVEQCAPCYQKALRATFTSIMLGIEPEKFRATMIDCTRKGEWEHVAFCMTLLLSTGSNNTLHSWEWCHDLQRGVK